MAVTMDLCDALLPAYKAVLDASAKTERTSRDQEGLKRSATERRGRDKKWAAPRDGAIAASSLSPGDIKIARDCLKALKVLKRLSDASESTLPSPQRAGDGQGPGRSSDSPLSSGLELQASSSGEEAQDEPLGPTLSSASHTSALTAASSFKSCCSAFDAGGHDEMRGLLWRARGSPVPDAEARALLGPLVGACRGSEVLPEPGTPGPRRREASSFAVLSLQCLQLLVSHGLLVGPAEDGTLVKQALEAIFVAYTKCVAACEPSERRVELETDVTQALLIFFCSPSLRVHGAPLLCALRILLHIQSHSLSSANRCLAKAAAAHLLTLAAQRAESGRPGAVEPAGACTPVALLPWGSMEMPTQETLRVVQQCMAQLMQEVVLVAPDCSPVRESTSRAQDAQEAEACGVPGDGQAGKDQAEEAGEEKIEEAQADAGRSPGTGTPSPRSAQGEQGTSGSAAALPSSNAGGAAEEGVAREAGEGAEAPWQASASGTGTAELGSVESQQSTVRWARSDSGCSATTSSSSASSATLRPGSCHGATPSLGAAPRDRAARRQVGRRRRALWAALTGRGRRRASVEALLAVEQAALLPAPALSDTMARAELLPQAFRVGNLEAMDRLFTSREFAPQQAEALPGAEGVQEERGAGVLGEGDWLLRRNSSRANLLMEDAVSALRLLCDLVGATGRKGGAEAGQELPLPDEAAALELLLWLLDCCGPRLQRSATVITLLRDRLCPALLRLWGMASPSVFALCHSVLLRLLALFRGPLLPHLRLLLPHMLLRPLEDRGAVHPRATWMALHLLHCLAQQPALLLGLYANLDCHLGSPALVERALAALASMAASPAAGAPPHDPRHQQGAAAEATLLALLGALRHWASGLPPARPGAGGPELGVVEEAEKACAEAGFVAGLRCGVGVEAAIQGRAGGGGAAEGWVGQGRSLQSLGEARKLFQDGVAAVSRGRTQSGLELLLKAHSRAYGHELSPALLLFRYGHCLEGAPVGELLGAKESASLLAAYMECFDFRGVTIDEALRMLLSNFRLPGEAQKIDRVMEAFAERFWSCNGGAAGDNGAASGAAGAYPMQNSGPLGSSGRGEPAPFRGGAATAHVLAFSIVMLHTDAHSPAVKVKMSKEDFVRNNRGVDDGQDLPAKLLSSLYDRIVSEEMRFLSPAPGAPAAGGGAPAQGGSGPGSGEGLSLRRSSTIQKLRGYERSGALSRSTSKKGPALPKPGSGLPRASSVPSLVNCPPPSPSPLGAAPGDTTGWLPLWDSDSPLPFSLPPSGSASRPSPGFSQGTPLQQQRPLTERKKGERKRDAGRRATVHGMSPLSEHSAADGGEGADSGAPCAGIGPERAWGEERWWRQALASGTNQDWSFPAGGEAEAAHMFFERALFPHLRRYLLAAVAQGQADAAPAAAPLDGAKRASSVHGAYPPPGAAREKLKVPHPRGIERSASVHADYACPGGADAAVGPLHAALLAPGPRAILGACAELAAALNVSGVHESLTRLLSDAADPGGPSPGLATPQSEPGLSLPMSSLYLAQEGPAASPLPRRQLHFEASGEASPSGAQPMGEKQLTGLHVAAS